MYSLFAYLRSVKSDLIGTYDWVCGLEATLQECRSEAKFEEFWQAAVNTYNSLAIDIIQKSSKEPKKCASHFDSNSCMTVPLRQKSMYYYSSLDILIHEIEDRFHSQAMNTVRYVSEKCIWNDRQPDDNDSIRVSRNTVWNSYTTSLY